MTNEYHYAYAVARTRAIEKYLLNDGIMEQLITADSLKKAIRILIDNGWELSNETGYYGFLSHRLDSVFSFIKENLNHPQDLSVLTAENDWHNLKATVKCIFSNQDVASCMLYPTVFSKDELRNLVHNHEFNSLDPRFSKACQHAFEVGAQTQNGQKIDIILDTACLKDIWRSCNKCACELTKKIGMLKIAGTDIKIAYRCAVLKKEKDFIKNCLCECDGLSISELASAAYKGEEVLFGYLSKTPYAYLASCLKKGTSAFEKKCDDSITELIKTTKWQTFGPEPLIAYYYANIAEVKMVRMILGAKQSGVSADVIRQRVRQLYV